MHRPEPERRDVVVTERSGAGTVLAAVLAAVLVVVLLWMFAFDGGDDGGVVPDEVDVTVEQPGGSEGE